MSVCRLCGNSDQIVDLFNPQLEKGKQLRYYILLATGIHIQEDDKISRMVCHRCCEISVKLYKYRANAVANDKVLQEESQLPYVPPVTDQLHLQRLGLQILMKDLSSSSVAELLDPSTFLCVTFDPDNLFNVTPKSNSLHADLPKHISVQNLLMKYPGLILPPEVYYSNINPVISIDESEVKEWQEKNLKTLHQKLLSTGISIRSIVAEKELPPNTIKSQNCSTMTQSEVSHSLTVTKTGMTPTALSKSTKLVIKSIKLKEKNKKVKDTHTLEDNAQKTASVEPKSQSQLKRSFCSNDKVKAEVPTKKVCKPSDDVLCLLDNKSEETSTQNVVNPLHSEMKDIASQTIAPVTKTVVNESLNSNSCDLCKDTFKCKESLDNHKQRPCLIKANTTALESIKANQIVKQVPKATETSNINDKFSKSCITDGDIINISDSEDESLPSGIDIRLFKKDLTEEQVIQLLFDKHYRSDEQHKLVQTFIPKKRNVKYLTPKLVSLVDMYKELLTYKIPIQFEAKPKIHAQFKNQVSKNVDKVILDWSKEKTITPTKQISCSLDQTLLKINPPKTYTLKKQETHKYPVTVSVSTPGGKNTKYYVVNTYSRKDVINLQSSPVVSEVINLDDDTPIQSPVSAPSIEYKSSQPKLSELSKNKSGSSLQNQQTVQKKGTKVAPTILKAPIKLLIPLPKPKSKESDQRLPLVKKKPAGVVKSIAVQQAQTILNGKTNIINHSESWPFDNGAPKFVVCSKKDLLTLNVNNKKLTTTNKSISHPMPVGLVSKNSTQTNSETQSSGVPTNSETNDSHKNLIRVKPPWQLY